MLLQVGFEAREERERRVRGQERSPLIRPDVLPVELAAGPREVHAIELPVRTVEDVAPAPIGLELPVLVGLECVEEVHLPFEEQGQPRLLPHPAAARCGRRSGKVGRGGDERRILGVQPEVGQDRVDHSREMRRGELRHGPRGHAGRGDRGGPHRDTRHELRRRATAKDAIGAEALRSSQPGDEHHRVAGKSKAWRLTRLELEQTGIEMSVREQPDAVAALPARRAPVLPKPQPSPAERRPSGSSRRACPGRSGPAGCAWRCRSPSGRSGARARNESAGSSTTGRRAASASKPGSRAPRPASPGSRSTPPATRAGRAWSRRPGAESTCPPAGPARCSTHNRPIAGRRQRRGSSGPGVRSPPGASRSARSSCRKASSRSASRMAWSRSTPAASACSRTNPASASIAVLPTETRTLSLMFLRIGVPHVDIIVAIPVHAMNETRDRGDRRGRRAIELHGPLEVPGHPDRGIRGAGVGVYEGSPVVLGVQRVDRVHRERVERVHRVLRVPTDHDVGQPRLVHRGEGVDERQHVAVARCVRRKGDVARPQRFQERRHPRYPGLTARRVPLGEGHGLTQRHRLTGLGCRWACSRGRERVRPRSRARSCMRRPRAPTPSRCRASPDPGSRPPGRSASGWEW